MSSGSENILVLNSGSSSLKFGLFAPGSDEHLLLRGSAVGIAQQNGSIEVSDVGGNTLLRRDNIVQSQEDALHVLLQQLEQNGYASPVAIGHRVVHGGPHLRDHCLITPAVMHDLEQAIHFAPLHIPTALQLIKQTESLFKVPQFACFDTAFHRTMPPAASHLPLPTRYFDQGVLRYGFHGLSCESVVHQLKPAVPRKLIVAHLGHGASVTAIRDGQSIDTTMGLSPTGGIIMSTRTGDLDPGVMLYLLRTERWEADRLEAFLNEECGMAALAGGEDDVKKLLKRRADGDGAAQLAIDAFCASVRKAIGGLVALLGGLDMLVFTGGIGEHSDVVRDLILQGLQDVLHGLQAPGGSKVIAMESQEEVQIARHCRSLLGNSAP